MFVPARSIDNLTSPLALRGYCACVWLGNTFQFFPLGFGFSYQAVAQGLWLDLSVFLVNYPFQGRLNSRSEPRTKLVAKTPIPQVLARVSLCWPPMTTCGHNVDTLRTCKRSNRDFFPLSSTGNTNHSLLCSLSLYYAQS